LGDKLAGEEGEKSEMIISQFVEVERRRGKVG